MKIASAPPAGMPGEGLYPELPAVPSDETTLNPLQDVVSFRLQKIGELQERLEGERGERATLYKKYRRGINLTDGIDTALTTVGMASGATGIALLAGGIVTAPVAVALEITALTCGLASVACKFVSRKLNVKARKHNDIRVLADSKLNTILDHVSRALKDHSISDDEFRMIMAEAEKFQELKREIRAKASHAHAAVKVKGEEKKRLIAQGREEARVDMVKAMGGNLP